MYMGMCVWLTLMHQTYNRFFKADPETPLASQFAQTLQQNRFGQLDADVLPSGVGPKLVADEDRKAAVKEAFVWSWDAYEKHAWGDDEVGPRAVSCLRPTVVDVRRCHGTGLDGTV